jgi:hypothetical protein
MDAPVAVMLLALRLVGGLESVLTLILEDAEEVPTELIVTILTV